MFLWISVGLIIIGVGLNIINCMSKSNWTIDNAYTKCLQIGVAFLILVGMFYIPIYNLPLSTLSDYFLVRTHSTQTKVIEKHNVYSVKTDDSNYICLQETTKNKYISKKYDIKDVTVIKGKGVISHIDTIQETAKVGSYWIAPEVTRSFTQYRLYVPLPSKSTSNTK